MSGKNEYIQCSIDGSRLKLFAYTQYFVRPECNNNGKNAEFWECTECEKIFYRYRISPENYLNINTDKYSHFKIFRLQATREELITLAERCYGYYSDYYDEKIINTREEKLKILNNIEKKLQNLEDLDSLNTYTITLAQSDQKEIGKNGLGVITVVINGEKLYAWCKRSYNIKKGRKILLLYEKINFSEQEKIETLFAII